MAELVGDLQRPYASIHKVDNCAIRVRVLVHGFRTRVAEIYLLSKQCPHTVLYKITLGRLTQIQATGCEPIAQAFNEIDWSLFNEFFTTWYGNVIRIGIIGHQHVLEFEDKSEKKLNIGFAKFMAITEYYFCPPQTIHFPRSIKIKGGKLKWMPMNGAKLPVDATIGGFENEPIYIARAKHRGSLCPGKYLPSKGCAFVAWGHREFSKNKFEILCGFDAKWVKCEGCSIPENAFIAGISEVNNEPLYIGRALVGSDLVCGKVHLLYGTCYVPYRGEEKEYQSYEILVSPDILPRGTQTKQCFCLNS